MNPAFRMIIGGAIGAAVGYALYRFVGCRTGACPLTANPWLAMLIWGIFGAVMAGGRS